MAESIVKTTNLTKYYGKSRGIIDLNLEVNKGDVFGFIGPNGAGKSTTIRTLLGLINATSGEGQIFGKDIVKDKKAILADIGYLPSEAMFYAGTKVSEMIKYSASLRGVKCDAEVWKLCERLQLDTSKKVEELSLGNRKKLGIVCAFLHKPSLYILDEPTSGLDPLMQKEFFDILEERNKEGATIFLSSHVLSEIQRHCNRAAIIREGKLVAGGSVEELSRTKAKRIMIRCMNAVPDEITERLGKVKDIKKEENSVSFLYGGEINHLMSTLAQYKLADVSVTEPDLEEIFMHYYTEGDRA